jgi:hypothetical protein
LNSIGYFTAPPVPEHFALPGAGGRSQATADLIDRNQKGESMTINRAVAFLFLIAAAALAGAATAMAQTCTRQGVDVTCDDGRHGIFAGDTITWADGTRSSLTSPHPSVIIGNKSSVIVGPGVFVGHGKGVVPMENPSAQTRCPVLDGVSYCY